MSPVFLFVLMAALAFRAARLIAQDAMPVFAVPREWVVARAERDGAGPVWDSLAYLVTCMWCVGVYTSGAVVLVTDLCTSVPVPWLMWGACSAAVGVVAEALGFADDLIDTRRNARPQVVVVPAPEADPRTRVPVRLPGLHGGD